MEKIPTRNCIIRGVEGVQHGRRILVGVISAKDLAALYESGVLKVDVFSVSNPDGYQRSLSKTRSRKFGKFIQDTEKGISPTSILIYSRDAIGGIEKIEPNVYQIPLSETSEPKLFICDGQHRTDGILEAFKEGWINADTNYDVPVTILFWDPTRSPRDQRLEEAMQFYTINTQQKRMRTDLAHQYIFKKHEAERGPIGPSTRLTRMRKKDYVPYTIYIANKLRTEQDSPWKDLILPPNAAGTAPISEGSFTDSLTPVIDYAITANLTMENIISLLKSFWRAVFDLCKNAYTTPQDYVLMKTPGVYSLHIFLPVLLVRKPNLGENPTYSQFKQVLTTIGDCFTDNFWESKSGEAASFGTGKKAFQELADHIIGEIP
ncbi:MAG: DGQHR domain-containing protein [Candidatus Jordarchaeaceae archaeon]